MYLSSQRTTERPRYRVDTNHREGTAVKAISIRTPRSPLTISRTQPASRLGGVTRTILGGAATVAGTYAIQRMSERRQTTAGPATSRLPKRFTRSANLA